MDGWTVARVMGAVGEGGVGWSRYIAAEAGGGESESGWITVDKKRLSSYWRVGGGG